MLTHGKLPGTQAIQKCSGQHCQLRSQPTASIRYKSSKWASFQVIPILSFKSSQLVPSKAGMSCLNQALLRLQIHEQIKCLLSYATEMLLHPYVQCPSLSLGLQPRSESWASCLSPGSWNLSEILITSRGRMSVSSSLEFGFLTPETANTYWTYNYIP